MASSKVCLRCTRTQPLSCYEPNRASIARDGHADVCIRCISDITTAENLEQARRQRARADLAAMIGWRDFSETGV